LKKLFPKSKKLAETTLPTFFKQLLADTSSNPDALPSHGKLNFLANENQANPLLAIMRERKCHMMPFYQIIMILTFVCCLSR
jgi:hypothetical protein